MTVSVAENFTEVDGADALTGWTTTSGAVYTGFQREDSGCLGDQASEGWEDPYFGVTSVDLSGVTIFGWCRSGNPDTKANNGFGILLGDGTNQIVYTVGGSDDAGHAVLLWSNYKIDCAIRDTTAGDHRVLTGTEASLSFTAITEIGFGLNYVSKALGNADNVFWDILKYIANGSAALSISGGTTGARGTFAEIVTEDISTANGAAYGILRELVGAKAYELFYGIEFGAATGDTFFEDADFQLYIIGTEMTAGNMDIDLVAGTGTNLFSLDNFTSVGIGTASNWDLSAAFETISITNGQLVDLGTITFAVSGGTLRQCTDTKFINCGQVDPSTMTFNNNSFVGTTDADGALLLPSSVTNLSGIDFISDGSGHAIEALNTGTYAYVGITDSGYTGTRGTNLTSSSGSSDAMFYNNSGGLITLNVSGGGQSPSVRNGAGATTQVNSSETVTVTVLDKNNVSIQNAQTSIYLTSDDSEVMNLDTNASGIASTSFGGGVPTDVYWRIRKGSTGATKYITRSGVGTIVSGGGLSFTVTLQEDTNNAT